jgi:hypothetical protein
MSRQNQVFSRKIYQKSHRQTFCLQIWSLRTGTKIRGMTYCEQIKNHIGKYQSQMDLAYKTRVYRDQLLQTESHLQRLLENTNDTLVTISYLSSSFNAVETSTTEFQAQCESILADQKRASELAEDISRNLQYYNYLEPITRRLNAPGASSMVLRGEFSDMLSNLDTCLDYMQAHVSMLSTLDSANFIAETKRSFSICIQVSAVAHSRLDNGPQSLYQLAQRCFYRCSETHLESST